MLSAKGAVVSEPGREKRAAFEEKLKSAKGERE